MKKPNITEGEWEVRDTCFGLMVCMKGKEIAIADCATAHIGEDEWENNLEAISAVPDMVEALMEIVAMYNLDKGNQKAIASNLEGLIETDVIPALKKAGVEI